MGSLRDLQSDTKNVHLLCTNSGLAEIYVYDRLKEHYKATLESVFIVETKADFKGMLSLVNIQPYLSDKWLFVISINKQITIDFIEKYKGIFSSMSSVFLVKVSRYGIFKSFKEKFTQCNDMYLSILRSNDVFYLFKECKLSNDLVQFISSSYSRDPEKIFELYNSISMGVEVRTSKDIVGLVGSSSSSVNRLVFLLLKDLPKSSKGQNTVIRNRIKVANELSRLYGSNALRVYILRGVKDVLDIKMLYLQGKIYNSIRDLPEVYDELKLSKYNFYLQMIKDEISFNKIIRLLSMLNEDNWSSELDLLNFFYKYYGVLGK